MISGSSSVSEFGVMEACKPTSSVKQLCGLLQHRSLKATIPETGVTIQSYQDRNNADIAEQTQASVASAFLKNQVKADKKQLKSIQESLERAVQDFNNEGALASHEAFSFTDSVNLQI